jgi:hypothetical protein
MNSSELTIGAVVNTRMYVLPVSSVSEQVAKGEGVFTLCAECALRNTKISRGKDKVVPVIN